MSLDALPPLREVLRRHGLVPRKALGQNFLLDLNLTRRIARVAGRLEGTLVVEVGPGPGGLTRALLAEGATRVVAIERDARCLAALEEIAAASEGRLDIVAADALTVDLHALTAGAERVRLVSNLPYNIGTELLVRWLTPTVWPPCYQSMTLMFQREVAERIVAAPGSAHYGRLSVLAGWRCQARILFDVPAQAFTPPPKVTSSLVHLVPREESDQIAPEALSRITRAAFGQRRKMLRQSLKAVGAEVLLARTGIDGRRRAETLSIEEFLSLAKASLPAARSGQADLL